MFCDERIKDVLLFCSYPDKDDEEYFFDIYYNKVITLHTTPGIGYYLETENHMIEIISTGVSIFDKKNWHLPRNRDASNQKYLINTEWLQDKEYTLFVGERLVSFEKEPDSFLLHFDDFDFRIVPCLVEKSEYEPYGDPYNESHDDFFEFVYGYNRLIRRKCNCGGHGRLFADNVHFFVRCDNCGESTSIELTPVEVIRLWNAGKRDWQIRDLEIRTFNPARFIDYNDPYFGCWNRRFRHRLVQKTRDAICYKHIHITQRKS